MKLEIGQQFRVRSTIAQRYQQQLGSFYFIVEICSLEASTETPTVKIHNRDLMFKPLYWHPRGVALRDEPWYACYCLSLGHDKYGEQQMNYSPDIITGQGEWYLPDLFRWQDKFLVLVRNGVVEYIGWKDPVKWRPHKYTGLS